MDRRPTQPSEPMSRISLWPCDEHDGGGCPSSAPPETVAAQGRKLRPAIAALGVLAALALGAGAARADDPPKKPEVRDMSGISILGNQDAPKALVIVPWKSSEIGNGIGISSSMNNRPVPVDKEVFGRQLHYFELRKADAPPAK